MVAADTAVIEIEELQGLIAEGLDKGFLAFETILAATEEAELGREQIRESVAATWRSMASR